MKDEFRTEYHLTIYLKGREHGYQVSESRLMKFYEPPALPRPGDMVEAWPADDPESDTAHARVDSIEYAYHGHERSLSHPSDRRPVIAINILATPLTIVGDDDAQ